MKEKDLISFIRSRAVHEKRVIVGPGDDAAVFAIPAGAEGIITTDATIEGAHFIMNECSGYDVAWKSAARNISDIAAMGAHPLVMVCSLCMRPGLDKMFFDEFHKGLVDCAKKYDAPLVGGDISSGKLVVSTVTIVGYCDKTRPVLRSGALSGDSICVTGALGGSRLGRHLRIEPRLFEALELVEKYDVHAMIDISDGLSTDALHIAEESNAGLLLESGRIPISGDARKMSEKDGKTPLVHALSDGEDFELLFTVPEKDAEMLARQGLAGTPVSIIGKVKPAEEKCRIIMENGDFFELTASGFEHNV